MEGRVVQETFIEPSLTANSRGAAKHTSTAIDVSSVGKRIC